MKLRIYYRHESCMGRGYKGAWVRGKWKLKNCYGCNSGEVTKEVTPEELNKLQRRGIQIRSTEVINEADNTIHE